MSSGVVAFNFPTAYLAAMSGNRIRRIAWTDRWLRFYNGLWWLIPATGKPRVVTTSDFSAQEFKALDWTHLSPACLSALQTSDPSNFPVCPAPYRPPQPELPMRYQRESQGGSQGESQKRSRGSSPPSGATGEPTLLFIGGGGGRVDPIEPTRPDPPAISWPSLSVEASTPDVCLMNDGTGQTSFTIAGSISLGQTSDPNAQERYFVTVKVGAKQHVFLMPLGSSRFFDDTIGPVNIGEGSVVVTSSAVMAHGPGTVISSNQILIQVPPACLFGFEGYLDSNTRFKTCTILDNDDPRPNGTIVSEWNTKGECRIIAATGDYSSWVGGVADESGRLQGSGVTIKSNTLSCIVNPSAGNPDGSRVTATLSNQIY